MATLTIDTQTCSEKEYTATIAFCQAMGGSVEIPLKVAIESVDIPKFDSPTSATPSQPVETDVTETPDANVGGAVNPNSQPPQEVVSTAPSAAEPAASAPTVSGELDSAGLPWDERIHAGTKTQNKDGTWKIRRGVDKALVEQVKAELVGGQQQPAPQQTTPAQTGDTHPSSIFAQGNQQQPVQNQAAADANGQNPFQVQPQGGQQQQPAPTAMTWPDFLNRMTTAQSNGTFNQQAAEKFLQANNVKNIALLANRADLFESFCQSVGI